MNKLWDESVDLYIDHMQKKYKDVTIKYKNQSLFMKILNIFVYIFNKDFMTHYTTTIGNTIYVPSKGWRRNNPNKFMTVISHELVHCRDRKELNKKFPLLFSLMYLFPQWLGIFSLLSFFAFINMAWLYCLIFLVFFLPLPAPGRFYLEARGYAMSLFFRKLINKYYNVPFESDKTAAGMVKYFTGPQYYFMFPFKNIVEKKIKYNLENKPSVVFSDIETWYNKYYGEEQ